MNFIAAGLSDVGLERSHNEDSYCILPQHRLFVVADGMGGHRAGDVASRMATHAISAFFDYLAEKQVDGLSWALEEDETLTDDQNRLVTAIKLANQRIFETSVKHPEVQGMGTTVVGAVFSRDDSVLYLAHVGDSRAYCIREGAISQLTRDHSLLNDYLLAMPNLSEEQKSQLPDNVITRALGMQQGVAVDAGEHPVQPGDVYLLCSDGLNGMISDEEILDLVSHAGDDVESMAKALIAAANHRGGEDNITVVVVRITG